MKHNGIAMLDRSRLPVARPVSSLPLWLMLTCQSVALALLVVAVGRNVEATADLRAVAAELREEQQHRGKMQAVRDEEIKQEAEIIAGLERIKKLSGEKP